MMSLIFAKQAARNMVKRSKRDKTCTMRKGVSNYNVKVCADGKERMKVRNCHLWHD